MVLCNHIGYEYQGKGDSMQGKYLINTNDKIKIHIMKRIILPGGKVPLEELYQEYGEKHNISEKKFISWLKKVKIKDREGLKIV